MHELSAAGLNPVTKETNQNEEIFPDHNDDDRWSGGFRDAGEDSRRWRPAAVLPAVLRPLSEQVINCEVREQPLYLAVFILGPLSRFTALTRAARLGMLPQFRWFACYLLAGILQGCARLAGEPVSLPYSTVWIRTAPFVILTSIAATIELWRMVMRSYPGVERIYHWLIPAFLGIAGVATALSAADLFLVEWRPTVFQTIRITYRYNASILLVICLLLFLWTLAFPQQISRNTRRHAALLSVNFLVVASSYFVIDIMNGKNTVTGPIMSVASAAVMFAWAALISLEGEEIPPTKPIDNEKANAAKRRQRDLADIKRILRPES